MKTSFRGLCALIAHEGVVPVPYLDSVGVWTWGIGHTAAAGEPDPKKMPRGMPVDFDFTLRRVFEQFQKDIAKYEAAVNAAIKVPMAQHEFDAAVSFHYNTGAIGKASWVKAFNAGNKTDALNRFMLYNKPASIIERREAEARLMATGKYPDAKATVWQVTDAGKVIWKPIRRLTQADIGAFLLTDEAPTASPATPAAPPSTGLLAAFLRVLAAIFGGKK